MLHQAPVSTDTLAAVFDHSTDCVKLIDRDGHLLWMNQGGLCAMEIDDFDLVKGGEWCSFWPEETAGLVRDCYTADPPKASRLTAFCQTAKGTPRWWEVSVVPVNDDDGSHFGFIATSRDVTDREMAVETREILLQEMRHRQGNTLTLAASLMQVHAIGQEHLSRFASEMGDRLSALGRAQGVVGRAETEGDAITLGSLLPLLVHPLAGPECMLGFDIPENLSMPAEKVDVVGVVMSELAVNSGKHGALRGGGEVRVVARQIGTTIKLTWTEWTFRPVATTARRGGQGLALMGRIAKVNNADFAVEWQSHGQEVSLTLHDCPSAPMGDLAA